jgi:hypothetical protein
MLAYKLANIITELRTGQIDRTNGQQQQQQHQQQHQQQKGKTRQGKTRIKNQFITEKAIVQHN